MMRKLMIFLVMIVFISFGFTGCLDTEENPDPSLYSTPDENTPDDDTNIDDTNLPASPTNVSAAAGDGQVTITWDEVDEAIEYNIYWYWWYWDTTTYVYKENGIKIENVSSPYIHTDLENDVIYYYVVTAISADGESEESVQVSARPTTLNVSAAAGDEQITITWDEVDEAIEYNIYYSIHSGVYKENGIKIENVSSPYIHTDLTNGTIYYYVVTIVSADGESEESEEVSATPTPPAVAPTNISAVARDGEVTITWGEIDDMKLAEAIEYNIYWDTAAGVTKENGTKISNVFSLYIHTNLANGTTYYYVVTAVNVNGESEESTEVSATPLAVPTNVLATAGDRRIILTWDEVDEALSYNIYWDASTGVNKENGIKIENVSSPYIHTDLDNIMYCYVVTVVNTDGESGESEEVSTIPTID